MPAVSNTSPISNLAFIGRLDLLKSQFADLWIPQAVARELKAHPDHVALAAIDAAIRDQWIRIATPQTTPLHKMLLLQLHPGEAEAIALAVELVADTIIIDEQEGRGLAAQAGLFVTGTLGVLLLAKQSGRISAVKPEIQALRSKARFFCPHHSKPKCSPRPANRCSAREPNRPERRSESQRGGGVIAEEVGIAHVAAGHGCRFMACLLHDSPLEGTVDGGLHDHARAQRIERGEWHSFNVQPILPGWP